MSNYPGKERVLSFLLNLITFNYWHSIERSVHIYMQSRYQEGTLHYVPVSKFKDWLYKTETWYFDPNWEKNLFTSDGFAHIHAGIIRFGSKNFILSSWGLYQSRKIVKKYIKEHFPHHQITVLT